MEQWSLNTVAVNTLISYTSFNFARKENEGIDVFMNDHLTRRNPEIARNATEETEHSEHLGEKL